MKMIHLQIFLYLLPSANAGIASVGYIHDFIYRKYNIAVPIKAANLDDAADMHYLYSAVDRANFLINGIATNYADAPNTRIVGMAKVADVIDKNIFAANHYIQSGLQGNFDAISNQHRPQPDNKHMDESGRSVKEYNTGRKSNLECQ